MILKIYSGRIEKWYDTYRMYHGENSTEPTLSRCRYSGHSVTPMNANVIYLGVRRDYLHKSQKISHLVHNIENNYEVKFLKNCYIFIGQFFIASSTN